jgi:hypothetical protein
MEERAMKEKNERNARVQTRYGQLAGEGKHGFYETLFRIVREEVERERGRCAAEAEHWQKISGPEHKCREYIAAAIRQGMP